MASFDRKLQKLVVRVVYDGPGFAGKTTNLKQICASFTQQRRGELFSPGETQGRTTLCDWLYLDGGIVGGYGLRCQLLTVPGQSVLAKRRWHVLGTADVVVFVCDSTPAGIDDARPWVELLQAFLSARDLSPPLIVQANKQDMPGALEPARVVAALDLDPGVPLVAARAASGIGVRETAVLAIRAAANLAQRRILEVGVDGLPEAEAGPEKLTGELRDVPEAPSRRRPRRRAFLQVKEAEPVKNAVAAAPEPVARAETIAEPPPDAPAPEADPPFPHAHAQSGFIWPAAAGRDFLRALARARQEGTVMTRVPSHDKLVYRVGTWCLKTSVARRYIDADEGRAALLDLARRKIQLGSLCASDTALSLVQDGSGAYWLWSLSPWLTTLEEEMRAARRSGNAAAIRELAGAHAMGAVHALALAVRHGALAVTIPAHLGRVQGRVHYLSDSTVAGEVAAAVRQVIAPLRAGESDHAADAYFAAAGHELTTLDLPLVKIVQEIEAAAEPADGPLIGRLGIELRAVALQRDAARAAATA